MTALQRALPGGPSQIGAVRCSGFLDYRAGAGMRRVIGVALLAAASLLAQDEMVELGGWRAQEGDDARWAAPDFDDSGWNVAAPLSAGSGAFWTSGWAPVTWYRVTYRIPSEWRGISLALGIWKLDDAYEVFAGGVKIGEFGTLPPPGIQDNRAVTAFSFRRVAFRIPPEACRDGEVRIAVRRWRLPGANSWELYEVAPFPNQLPVIGLTGTVQREREIRVTRTYIRGLPGMLELLLTFACGGLCLAMRRRGEDTELLWAGLALLALGAQTALWLPMTLGDWPKTALLPLAWIFLTGTASSLFLGWFLAEMIPEWRRWIRWVSIPIALTASTAGISSPLIIGSRMGLLAVALVCAWEIWRCHRRGIAVVLAVAMKPWLQLFTGTSSGWNSLNYYSVGPFLISLRRTSDALIALAIATLLYARVRRERAQRQEVTRDLEAARRVQEALLGNAEAASSAFAVDAVYLPAREVGGDFYQTLPGEDGSLLVVVGDVAGKGLQAAMLVASVIGSLRNEFSRAPGEVLAHLNRSLLGQARGGFVTCCCARFDPDGTVTVANAGHLAPYAGGCEVEVEAGLPLGIAAGMEYAEVRLAMVEPFLLVSDGVVEAASETGELFGFERTRGISGKTAGEIAAAAQAWGQNDDITVVAVRRIG